MGPADLIIRNRDDGLDDFLDAFIDEAIEANGCYCGGGGTAEKLSFVMELGRRSDSPDDKLKRIAEWLDSRTDIENWKAGEEFDLWHGDFNDLEGED
ncbi:MAG: 50S ribosome-binding protein YggL [Desulfobacteraceae bacterium]